MTILGDRQEQFLDWKCMFKIPFDKMLNCGMLSSLQKANVSRIHKNLSDCPKRAGLLGVWE